MIMHYVRALAWQYHANWNNIQVLCLGITFGIPSMVPFSRSPLNKSSHMGSPRFLSDHLKNP